jgi:hypothetical protein
LASVDGIPALQKRLAAISDTRMLLGKVGLLAVREAKAIVPRRTGNLGRTIRLGTVTSDSVEVLAGGRLTVGYAAAVEFGTKPHRIVPRRAKALAWGGGRTLGGRLRVGQRPTHFARSVRHPGTRKRPYLVPGIRLALKKAGVKATISDSWNRAA